MFEMELFTAALKQGSWFAFAIILWCMYDRRSAEREKRTEEKMNEREQRFEERMEKKDRQFHETLAKSQDILEKYAVAFADLKEVKEEVREVKIDLTEIKLLVKK